MMEKAKLTEMKVGFFLLVGTILFLAFVMFLGGDKPLLERMTTLILKSDDSLGLSVGSPIQISGVPSGNVSQITFENGSNKLNIYLSIKNQYASKVTKGSVIGVYTQGALGDKYISIKPGPPDAPPMKDGDYFENEVAGDLFSTIGKSANKVEKVFDILENIERLLRGLNENNVGPNMAKTVANIRDATNSLDQILSSIRGQSVADNKLKKSLDHLASILEKIDKGQGSLGGLINDPTVHEDLKALLGGAKRNKLMKYLIRQTIQKSEEENAPPSR